MIRHVGHAATGLLAPPARGTSRQVTVLSLIALMLLGFAVGCTSTRVVNWKPRHALGMTGPTTRAAQVTGDVTLEDVLDDTYNASKKVWVAIPAGPDGKSIVWVPMN